MSEPWEYVFNAISKQLSEQGDWLRLSARQALAKRAVAAIEEAGFRLLPPGGEVSSQLGCRIGDELRGVVVEEATSRKDADLRVGYHRRVYATRGTYGGIAELVRRYVHTGPWEVLSDNSSEVPNGGPKIISEGETA